MSPENQDLTDARAETARSIVNLLKDTEQHKSTSLCAIGTLLLTSAAIYVSAAWPPTFSEMGLHSIPPLAMGGAGYLLLHIGKCLMAPQ